MDLKLIRPSPPADSARTAESEMARHYRVWFAIGLFCAFLSCVVGLAVLSLPVFGGWTRFLSIIFFGLSTFFVYVMRSEHRARKEDERA